MSLVAGFGLMRLSPLNPARLVIGLFNGKDEERISISDTDDIYKFAERLKITVSTYEQA
ncbi:MAG TPA: hypothetical protein PLU46_11065 [Thiotrichales bacterium]|nr:MAG: hypothetical protein JSU84_05555 [Thiotrichales bacterium]HQT05516.1 hypothetical protein [Thiotrichales bacterium]